MNFVIITHVPHIVEQNHYFAYAPYVREMNIWIKQVDKVILVAPESNSRKTPIDIKYHHENIEFIAVEGFDVLGLKAVFDSIFKIPGICWNIYSAMQKADHIHLRCPGNMGLLASLIQILFPKKIKTAKYAGNWDPKSKQPLSYKLQKWILSNTFLTRNMQVLVYGKWEGSSKNIKPFFTATYHEVDKLPIVPKNLQQQICFVFVGTLVSGKNPLYAIQLVEALCQKGHNVALSLYGEGAERNKLEQYIVENKLDDIISLEGNQTHEMVRKAYEQSHFVILPSESEGWPKAVAEGMFWGCVPVATPVSCVPFMLDYGNRGILLEMTREHSSNWRSNLEKDAYQLELVLKNEIDCQGKSQKASDWSRKYTLDVFEDEIEKLLTR
ncbi:Glycosyltransferase involved in cell wall bisynthesis [Flavobacterium fluvii]|uniref:Glycosyltransferase involved in cell wall bisynthesis n=1 Tax=Flavobacterium fluvii TaxID=468056 RepID=A0A1M5PDL6_9FLAO|nr:glycosyltransferase [Flavobacterium fluvii]SHG99865.1 Glycosyltransferase involved in cell wall bisynthesis [Flavobacterium fluvii]